MKKNAALQIIALALAFILIAGVVVGVIFWQKGNISFTPVGQEQTETSDEETSANTENGGAVIGAPVENGIKLMSAKIPVAEFAANGVSAQAETAYTLTATVVPDTATDTSVDWEVAFVNAESAWASGKNVTDYVTVTPTADGALTANVECLQAFGEQVLVTVVSRDNPLATATCTIDYAQKVTGATLKLGDITVNLGGTTNVKWQINANGEGFGGAPDLDYTVNDVYTLAEDFTASIELIAKTYVSPENTIEFGGKKWSCRGDFFGDITASGIVFDRSLLTACDFISYGRANDIVLNDVSASELLEYTSSVQNGTFADVVITFTGEHGSCEFSSHINISEFVNTASVTGISLGNSSLVF